MTIGERIKQRRLELNLTQDELAHKVGYKSRSSINKIELSRDLPLNKIKLMAEALETTPAYLVGWEDEEFEPDQAKNAPFDYTLELDDKTKVMIEKYQRLSPKNQTLFEEMIEALLNKHPE